MGLEASSPAACIKIFAIINSPYWDSSACRLVGAARHLEGNPCMIPKIRVILRAGFLSEKRGIFSDMRSPSASLVQRPTAITPGAATSGTSVDAAIRAKLHQMPPGQVFSASDFVSLGSRAAVDKVLSRLTAGGELRRIARGLYDIPRTHQLLGPLLPAADDIARAIADKGRLRLQPSGAYAANLLGLTEQVPMKLVFLTDGASRTVQVGSQSILLKHTTPRNMATAGRISGLVIQALRHLKQANVDAQTVARLRARLTVQDKAVLLADAPLAPVWIADIMRDIASGKG